ncbi:MAG TPA: hypothetical protein ENJ95_13490 [Bacteroidetes bacterium]|nr:hypothetical protein [Bacteroidota bacterium]
MVLMQSCKTEEDTYSPDFGFDYLELRVGKYIVYEVDSTIYDPTGDTSVFFSKTFFKEEITDTLLDNNGEILYRTERFERKAEGDPWQVTKVFTQSVQGSQGIITEDNLRFVKMNFPPRKFASWDGTVHFDNSIIVSVAGESLEMFKGWRSRITELGEPDSIGNFVFDNVLTLREADNESNIEYRYSIEKYAKGIGLAYRERWILDTQKCQEDCQVFENNFNDCIADCIALIPSPTQADSTQCESQCGGEFLDFNLCQENCNALPWDEKAQKGFILKQTIIEFN